MIFIGAVIDRGIISFDDDPWHTSVRSVRFMVIERFRGLSPETQIVDLKLIMLSEMCSPIPYMRGRRYLVTPSKRDGALWDGVCFSGKDIETVPDDVRYVREYFKGKTQASIQGVIA